MDLQKEREAFEKLPDINEILHNSEFGFNEGINQYYHPNHTEHRLSYAFLMGAWSAWQAKAQAIPAGFVLVEREKLAMIFETATNALVYHAAPPKHDALSIIQGIARKAMIEAQEPAND